MCRFSCYSPPLNTQRLTAGMRAKIINEAPITIKGLRRISLDTSQLAARSFILRNNLILRLCCDQVIHLSNIKYRRDGLIAARGIKSECASCCG